MDLNMYMYIQSLGRINGMNSYKIVYLDEFSYIQFKVVHAVDIHMAVNMAREFCRFQYGLLDIVKE